MRTSSAFTNGALVPAPASPATPVVPSVGKPYKFVLASSKVIASWFGISCEYVIIPQNTQTCLAIIKEYYKHVLTQHVLSPLQRDCPDDSIWGCYVTKSCWKVVIIALGAIFLMVAILMAIFFLGQIENVLKYQGQLTEIEKTFPTLAKIMIHPLKLFYKAFTKAYSRSMKQLTRKFGKTTWFKFLVVFPCKCLRGTWTLFQKCLQPTCTRCFEKQKYTADTGFFQFYTDKVLKKAGLRNDPEGDKERAKEDAKQAELDKKQARIAERFARKEAKKKAKAARKEAKRTAREGRNDAALDALEEDAEEAKRAAEEAGEEAKEAEAAGEEAKEAAEDAKLEAEEKPVAKAPPASPAPPSPPPPPPAPPSSPIPSGRALTMPTAPAPAVANQQGKNAAPGQQYVDPYAALGQQYVDPYATQQYVDPYAAQQYAADPYAQAQGYGAYGQQQYGMNANDPMYAQQQQANDSNLYAQQQRGAYGQDQYGGAAAGQQAAGYGYDPNAAYAQQYPQQQYARPQYYGQ